MTKEIKKPWVLLDLMNSNAFQKSYFKVSFKVKSQSGMKTWDQATLV